MFPTINKKETGVNLRRIMDMRGVKPKDIQEYLGFGCVQSVYRWLDGVSMPTVDNLYSKAMDEFTERFGLFGNKLQTEKELEENRKRGGGGTIHFMDELPEYKEISDKYREEEKRLEEYRRKCKDEAIDMLKQYFYDLWD